MSIKNIRNEIYGNQKRASVNMAKTTNEVMQPIIDSDDEDKKNIWEPLSNDIKNIKKVIETLIDDPDQWEGENKRESTNNLSKYIDDICDSLHKEQIQKDDRDVFD